MIAEQYESAFFGDVFNTVDPYSEKQQAKEPARPAADKIPDILNEFYNFHFFINHAYGG
jgi:hypothetical protein